MSEVQVREAVAEELEQVLGVQRRAFGRVSRALGIDPANLPPLNETAEDLGGLMAGGTRFWIALAPAELTPIVVGSVRAAEREGTVEIGRLVVDDGWTGRGVATALMDVLEAAFPHAERFELFTGADAHVPLALYVKRGYAVYRSAHVSGVDLVWLQKQGPYFR